ncbi:MAG TPA: DUF1510 family protein [Chondromyces sp.]|nr:DUF1510 family protein [Chondromyces sp.]
MATPSRSEKKLKRRKTNRILNTAIAVVLLLIAVVSFFIFAGGNDEEVNNSIENAAQEKEEQTQPSNQQEETADTEQQEEEANEEEEEPATDQEVVQDSDEPNVDKEITNPAWAPIGTSQGEGHVNSFDSGSVDWNEKLQAISYATGIPVENMTVWYISGNGPKGAIGTVSPKDNPDDAYRVYIEWVDGEGWKPEKMLKLIENDKGR